MASLSEAVVKILDGYEITESIRTSGGHVLALRYSTAPDGVPVLMNYNIMTHGTFFLFALVLAVPDTKWRLRLKIGIIAGALIFAAQVARVVVFAFNHYGQHVRLDGEWVYPELVVYGLFYANRFFDVAANQVFPVVIWACLYFYYVWHRQFRKDMADKLSGSVH